MICLRRPPPADIAVFHEFAPPPTGGGHQFMRALCQEFERRGLRLACNELPKGTSVCLCNSYNFNLRKLERALKKHPATRCVHRIDGPLQTYRGFDDGTDALISDFNRKHAAATIAQSRFSLEAHQSLGLSARDPRIIPNTPDPEIFHPRGRSSPGPTDKLRVISASWSDNPNKGLDLYQWLDTHLDHTRIDYTFVGRIQTTLKNIRHIPPQDSPALADLLRQHHVYLTASRNDPCSNSVLEALACGLPVLYLNSGGHPELVQNAGLPFDTPEQIPALLENLAQNLPAVQANIRVPTLTETADQYLQILMA
ncbi:MAG: glycosyltransferase family 4 protein [Kiritimatiellae bacterium]|nr:glycosyltransferase family 4 protein [Kiritimatiellia bacterium]